MSWGKWDGSESHAGEWLPGCIHHARSSGTPGPLHLRTQSRAVAGRRRRKVAPFRSRSRTHKGSLARMNHLQPPQEVLSAENTAELHPLMTISNAVLCYKKKTQKGNSYTY